MSWHGVPAEVDRDVWLGPDPALALAVADMAAWLAAHECACEALCTCETEQDAKRG